MFSVKVVQTWIFLRKEFEGSYSLYMEKIHSSAFLKVRFGN